MLTADRFFMASRIVTLPNLLTFFRMVLIPFFVTALFYQRFLWALAIFVLAGVTDGLDGLLARRFNQKSQLGTILDPIADKLLLVTAFITLSLPSIMAPGALPNPHPRHLPVPFWVTAAVFSRDLFIVVGAAAINIVTGFRGFRPTWLGKVSTAIQIFAIGYILTAASFPPPARLSADRLHHRLHFRRHLRRTLRLLGFLPAERVAPRARRDLRERPPKSASKPLPSTRQLPLWGVAWRRVNLLLPAI